MSRYCTICSHPHRDRIDCALAAGATRKAVAQHFQVSIQALGRHRAAHLPALVTRLEDVRTLEHAAEVLRELQALQERTLEALADAEEEGDFRATMTAVREARANLALSAKVARSMEVRPDAEIVASPYWLRIRDTIYGALENY